MPIDKDTFFGVGIAFTVYAWLDKSLHTWDNDIHITFGTSQWELWYSLTTKLFWILYVHTTEHLYYLVNVLKKGRGIHCGDQMHSGLWRSRRPYQGTTLRHLPLTGTMLYPFYNMDHIYIYIYIYVIWLRKWHNKTRIKAEIRCINFTPY